MLSLTPVAALDVSAASGLVVLGDRLYVIADDETFLSAYALDGTPRSRTPLLSGVLPTEHAARKRHKPDLEALALLPGDRLLALGSGSTEARMRGAVVDPRAATLRAIDLRPLYEQLRNELSDLNVEGAAVRGDALVLLQRGNGAGRVNACIELDLGRALAALDARGVLSPDALRSIAPVALGDLDGVPLGFTDAVASPSGGLLFSAAAEDTPDSYQDGPCAGSIVGLLSQGRVMRRLRVSPTCKIEGLALGSGTGRELALWLVADPDDRKQPATLYRATMAL